MPTSCIRGNLVLGTVALLLIAAVASCSLSGNDEKKEAVISGLGGSWMWTGSVTSVSCCENSTADALVLDISDLQITAVYYAQTEQVAGFKGTYSLGEDHLNISQTHEWNRGWDPDDEASGGPVWNKLQGTKSFSLPFELNGHALALGLPETAAASIGSITLERTSFGTPAALVGWWNRSAKIAPKKDGSHRIRFDDSGGYEYHWKPDTDGTGSGNWDASGVTAGYVRTVVTECVLGETEIEDLSWGFLHPYQFDGDEVTISYGEGDEGYLLDRDYSGGM